MRCAKCGVAVLLASIFDWGVSLPWVFVHCATYKLIWCHGFAEIYVLLEGGQSAIGICALFYIYRYRSSMRCANFGVAVFKASMVDCRGQSAMGICALFYIYIDLP